MCARVKGLGRSLSNDTVVILGELGKTIYGPIFSTMLNGRVRVKLMHLILGAKGNYELYMRVSGI